MPRAGLTLLFDPLLSLNLTTPSINMIAFLDPSPSPSPPVGERGFLWRNSSLLIPRPFGERISIKLPRPTGERTEVRGEDTSKDPLSPRPGRGGRGERIKPAPLDAERVTGDNPSCLLAHISEAFQKRHGRGTPNLIRRAFVSIGSS
jgi:hypothetical protein